jgi:beta-barrel assembly-enhancing protease
MRNRSRSRQSLVTLLTLGLLTVIIGCGSMPILISTEQEIALGVEAAPQFEEQLGGRVPNERLQTYVQSVGQTVAKESGRDVPYDFVLVNEEVPNALALPGGKIFLTAGLMKLMENEQQLAAVLGHETAHVARRHNVRMIQNQMGVSVLASLAGKAGGEYGGAAEAGTKIAGAMSNLSYSREYEFEADQYGAEYIQAAGYNPYGMVQLLELLLSLHEQEPGKLEQMFMTHPLTTERVAHVQGILEAEGKFSASTPDPGAMRFQEMRALLVETTGP